MALATRPSGKKDRAGADPQGGDMFDAVKESLI